MKEKVITTGIVLNLVHYAHQRQIPLGPFDLGVLLREKDINNMIPFSQYAHLLEYVLEKTGDEKLGIHMGRQYNLTALGIVGQLIQTAETLNEALLKACEMYNLINNVIHLKMNKDVDSFRLEFQIDQEIAESFPEAVRHFLMASMIYAHMEISYLTLNEVTPISVGLSQWKNTSEALTEIFNTRGIEPDGDNYLHYDSRVLKKRIVWSDYDLYLQLEKVANARLSHKSELATRLPHHVKEVILSLLNPHFPSIAEVADQLNLSVRNLQRKLKLENTSYQEIKAEVKKALAKDYLSRGLSVKETCFLMGYSDPSAFINAFNRWYGMPPNRFKEEKISRN